MGLHPCDNYEVAELIKPEILVLVCIEIGLRNDAWPRCFGSNFKQDTKLNRMDGSKEDRWLLIIIGKLILTGAFICGEPYIGLRYRQLNSTNIPLLKRRYVLLASLFEIVSLSSAALLPPVVHMESF